MSRRSKKLKGPGPGVTTGAVAVTGTERAQRVPVKLNRNFLNFPLARDARTKAEWFQGSKTGRWMADLPGEGRDTHGIRLILPGNSPSDARRCPTPLDMNVLFQLLAEAQRQDATMRIEFASFAVLLRRLGLEERNRERRRVQASLLYWTWLSIRWSRWYQRREHVKLTLPPPINNAERDGNRIIITLDADWFRLARATGYYEWLPLPLPPGAVAQNLILLILTQEMMGGFAAEQENPLVLGEYWQQTASSTQPMDRWWLARKLGLLHKQRNNVVNRAVGQAAEWFSAHGGKLKQAAVPIDDEEMSSVQIAFDFIKPPVPRLVRRRKRRSSMGRSHGPPHLKFGTRPFPRASRLGRQSPPPKHIV